MVAPLALLCMRLLHSSFRGMRLLAVTTTMDVRVHQHKRAEVSPGSVRSVSGMSRRIIGPCHKTLSFLIMSSSWHDPLLGGHESQIVGSQPCVGE